MADTEDLKLILKAETAAAVKELKKAATEYAKLKGSTKSLADAFKDQMSRSLSAKNALLQLTSSVAGGVAVYNLAAKSFHAMTGFVKSSVEAFGEYESIQSKLAVVLGDSKKAAEAFADLKEQAAKTPFSVTELADAAVQLKQTGTSMGEMTETLGMLGDAAGGSEEKFRRMVANYAQIQSVGKTTAMDLRQFAQMGLPIYETLRKMGVQGAATGEQITEAFRIMTSEGGVFFGGMEAGAATLAGKASILNSAWKDFKATFVETKGLGEWWKDRLDDATAVTNKITEALEKQRQLQDARAARDAGTSTMEQNLLVARAELADHEAFVLTLRRTQPQLYAAQKEGHDATTLSLRKHIEALEETVSLENSLAAVVATATQNREAEATAAEAASARQQKAADYYQAALDGYTATIAKMEIEARLRGESVTAQERLNAAQQAYVALVTESKGLVTESGPSAAAFQSAVDLPGLSADAKQEENLIRITAILAKAKQAADEYGLSQVDLNYIALENSGATMEQISAYTTYVAELKRLGHETEDAATIFDSMTETLKEQAQSLAAGGLTDMFSDMGEAMASNADVGAAAAAAVNNFAQECLRQVSSLAITSGLRILAETGVAGIPLALGLFAIGGVAGIVGGLLGGSRSGGGLGLGVTPVDYKKYISDPIVGAEKDNSRRRIEILKEQLDEEKKLRDEHVDELEEHFAQEYAVLKDLWDRNLISTDEFRGRADDLREARNTAIDTADHEYEAIETETNRQIEAAKFKETQDKAVTELYEQLAAMGGGMSDYDLKRLGSNAHRVGGNAHGYNEQVYEDRLLLIRGDGQKDYLKERAKANYSIAAIQNAQSQEEMDQALRLLGGKVNSNQEIEQVRRDKLLLLTAEQQIYADAAAVETSPYNKVLYESLVSEFADRIKKAEAATDKETIIAARSGADFTTSGPQMLLVGDNPTGRERVQVTPIGSPNINGPHPGGNNGETRTVNIYIAGGVYGVDDLYLKLEAAGRALARKGRL
jgi:hypothetical protein